MRIRPATAEDAACLAQLRWDFRSVAHGIAEEREADFVERCTVWMRSRLSDAGQWRAWIADENDETVGQIWVHLIEKIPNPTSEPDYHAYITNLYVKPSARGGTGTCLLDACLEWLAGRGIDRVVLWPSPRARSLYERRGFDPDRDVLHRRGPL